jgi:hypothetical protein
MRFSPFDVELARDSDKTFNLSTCSYKQTIVGDSWHSF